MNILTFCFLMLRAFKNLFTKCLELRKQFVTACLEYAKKWPQFLENFSLLRACDNNLFLYICAACGNNFACSLRVRWKKSASSVFPYLRLMRALSWPLLRISRPLEVSVQKPASDRVGDGGVAPPPPPTCMETSNLRMFLCPFCCEVFIYLNAVVSFIQPGV